MYFMILTYFGNDDKSNKKTLAKAVDIIIKLAQSPWCEGTFYMAKQAYFTSLHLSEVGKIPLAYIAK